MAQEQQNIADVMARSGVTFGTSGARGRVVDMRPQVCYAYTRAFLQHLETTQNLPANSAVALAGDLRVSTPKIMAAVACAIVDGGYLPRNCGHIPTPAVALYGLQQGIPSIMVTGSHIPDDRNGIKFYKLGGEILKDDEAGIRAQQVAMPEDLETRMASALPPVDDAAAESYLQRYRDFFPLGALAGMRVGLYEHSGVGRDLFYRLLVDLGAEVVRLARSTEFIPVDTEAIRPEDVVLGKQWAVEYALDALVSSDGDADRPLIGTQTGEWIRGDVAGVLCGRYLGVHSMVTPVSSNTLVEACGAFSRVVRTRIGSPYVIAAMETALTTAPSVGGYEANGGFLLASSVVRSGRTLAPLPTRDAILVILCVLTDARERHLPVGALLATLPPRYTASDRLKAFPSTLSERCLQRFMAEDGQPDVAALESVFARLCGRVAAVDTTDGLRISFANKEIVHLRPSGNAPEFRCYNEADSQERVQALNQACMAQLAQWRG